jgi:hypothetical protein
LRDPVVGHLAPDGACKAHRHRAALYCAAVNDLGYYYRRGVQSSLTQIGDMRQLDFIAAFDQLLRETAEDPDADRLLPKAVRTYCAIITHHLSQIDRFEPAVARRLKARSAGALGRMPQDVLERTLSCLDHRRAAQLGRLRRQAPAEAAA